MAALKVSQSVIYSIALLHRVIMKRLDDSTLCVCLSICLSVCLVCLSSLSPFSPSQVIPIFVFAYTCHQNYPVLLNEMARPSKARVSQAIAGASSITLITYLVIAEAGYWTYGAMMKNDILQTFPSSNMITALRAFMSLLVTFTYPLQVSKHYEARQTFDYPTPPR